MNIKLAYFLKAVFLPAFIFSFISSAAEARPYIGGTFSARIDTRGTYIDVSPDIGYGYSIFNFGLSPFYSYSDRYSEERQTYGTGVYTQATLFGGSEATDQKALFRSRSPFHRWGWANRSEFFLHAEMQFTNFEKSDGEGREWVTSFPVGAGFRYRIGRGSRVYAKIIYDLDLDERSSKRNPDFSVGIRHTF